MPANLIRMAGHTYRVRANPENQAVKMPGSRCGAKAGANKTGSGISLVYFESPGGVPARLTWRRSLNDFTPELFQ
jgi:hypothetical protein